jgi:hypothetical protein
LAAHKKLAVSCHFAIFLSPVNFDFHFILFLTRSDPENHDTINFHVAASRQHPTATSPKRCSRRRLLGLARPLSAFCTMIFFQGGFSTVAWSSNLKAAATTLSPRIVETVQSFSCFG